MLFALKWRNYIVVGSCQSGYTKYQATGICYWLSDNKKSWQDAYNDCVNKGSGDRAKRTIALVNNEATKNFIKDNLLANAGKGYNEYWIGLTDGGTEGQYVWKDGSSTAVTWTFWKTGQPGGGGNSKDCVFAKVKDDHGWEDAKCNDQHYYVCEHTAAGMLQQQKPCVRSENTSRSMY